MHSGARWIRCVGGRRSISTVGVLGAGQMGGGIAQVAAVVAERQVANGRRSAGQPGGQVVLVDSSPAQLAKATGLIGVARAARGANVRQPSS